MNSKIEYNDIFAFHPGYYISEIIEELGVNQAEFAARMGTTPKTISLLVNGRCNLSNDLALKISAMLGSSVEVWLNLQKVFDEKVIEIEREKSLNEQTEVMQMIDYSYFVEVANLPATKVVSEKITNLCQYLLVGDLRTLKQPDYLVNYRTVINDVQEKNIVNSRAWVQAALNIAKDIDVAPFNDNVLAEYLPEIRSMTLQPPSSFVPRLNDLFSTCGVAFVIMPHLKNSGVNGAVKWYNNQKVLLAVSNRRLYADTFWFSLFHEIKHILQQKTKRVFVSGASELIDSDKLLEDDADNFSRDYLIPPRDYADFNPTRFVTDAEIVAFAEKIKIHPGVVAGRLQHDNIIPQNRCSKLKERYYLSALTR